MIMEEGVILIPTRDNIANSNGKKRHKNKPAENGISHLLFPKDKRGEVVARAAHK
jgi:hypothetical protein